MTPEGREKKKLKEYLNKIGAYYFCPVQQGFGQQGLDFFACIDGQFWGLETKREGKTPTPRQEVIMSNILAAKGCYAWGTADKIISALRAA